MAVAPKIAAPIAGEIIEITEVPDPVFAGKMMGEGFGVSAPSSGTVVSPVAGEVTMTTDTGHAFGLRSTEGLEILVHLGIDTVELEGRPFTVTARKGQQVAVGDVLGTMDLEDVKAAGKDPTAIVAVTNTQQVLASLTVEAGPAEAGSFAAEARLKGVEYDDAAAASAAKPASASGWEGTEGQGGARGSEQERQSKKGLFGFLRK